MENVAWYIERRGKLLAEQFLLALSPDNILLNQEGPFDYLAVFTQKDGAPILIGIQVKATEREIGGRYHLQANLANRLLRANIPVLVVVIDVKTNEVYFEWIDNAISPERQDSLE